MVSSVVGYAPTIGLCTLLTVRGGVAIATDAPSNALYQFDIPEEQLRDALQALALSASRKLFYRSSIVQGVVSRPLKGRYTLDQAIGALLSGTGLRYEITRSGVILISPKRASLFSRIATSIAAMLAALAVGVPAAALAQTSPDQQPAQAADQLQEVVVTAERRSTDIMSTPISVVAVSGTQLQSAQITDVNSLGQVAPNLLVYNTGLSSSADIRGIGNSNQGGDEVPGVAIIRDGLPNPTTVGENVPYYDITDVEVLRGPQGTFTGASSSGGAIDINSANPDFKGMNGYVDATVATYSEQKLQGALNLPITDTLALRLAFNEETRGSFFHDLATQFGGPLEGGPSISASGQYPSSSHTEADPGNVDDRDMRFSVLWKPTGNFQTLTKIEFDNEDSDGVPMQPDTYGFGPLAPGLACPAGDGTAPNCHSTYAPGYSGSPYVLNNWASQMLKANTDSEVYSNESRFTLPDGIVLRSVLGDQIINTDQLASTSNDTLNVGSYTQTGGYYKTYSAELDAISPTTGPLAWIAGASMYYNQWTPQLYGVNVLSPYSVTAPAITTWTDDLIVETEQHAMFGQVSWQFTPTLQLVAGGRMSWDVGFNHCDPTTATQLKYCTEDNRLGYNIYRPGAAPIDLIPGISNSDRVLTGKVDLNWTPLPGQYFYGFVARGYKPGLANLGNEPPTHYEFVNDYEGGWKGKFADGHVQVMLGGYYQQYMDMIHSVFDPELANNSSEANIPFSILKGIEASFEGNVGHFSANINGAYNKSVLGNLVTAATYKFPQGTEIGVTNQCAPGVAPSNSPSGCTDYTGSYPGDTSYLVTLSGESLPFAPTYTFYGTLQYAIPVGATSVVPRVSYSYRSKTYSDIFQLDNYYLLPGYSLWNAYLDWEAGSWTTTLYATNLANSVYLEGTGLYGDPRQLGVEFRKTF
jgi:iron complex outermembrane receptor protein